MIKSVEEADFNFQYNLLQNIQSAMKDHDRYGRDKYGQSMKPWFLKKASRSLYRVYIASQSVQKLKMIAQGFVDQGMIHRDCTTAPYRIDFHKIASNVKRLPHQAPITEKVINELLMVLPACTEYISTHKELTDWYVHSLLGDTLEDEIDHCVDNLCVNRRRSIFISDTAWIQEQRSTKERAETEQQEKKAAKEAQKIAREAAKKKKEEDEAAKKKAAEEKKTACDAKKREQAAAKKKAAEEKKTASETKKREQAAAKEKAAEEKKNANEEATRKRADAGVNRESPSKKARNCIESNSTNDTTNAALKLKDALAQIAALEKKLEEQERKRSLDQGAQQPPTKRGKILEAPTTTGVVLPPTISSTEIITKAKEDFRTWQLTARGSREKHTSSYCCCNQCFVDTNDNMQAIDEELLQPCYSKGKKNRHRHFGCALTKTKMLECVLCSYN